MRDKFVVTITDINGSKHFMLHQLIKRFIVYFTLFVIAIIVFGAWYINFLTKEVSSLEGKKETLIEKQQTLNNDNASLQQRIADKAHQLEMIQDKVSDIEELIGLKPTEKTDLNTRLENISLSGSQQKALFALIPNGEVVPMKGISGKFGWRKHPILKRKEFHRGLDIRADMKTPIIAPADGVIEYAGYHKSSGFGYLVIMNHSFGFKTSYAHMYKKMVVKEGQFVKKGDHIGYTGNSGLSTGPHLHYEVRFVSRPLDPKNFIKWKSNNFNQIFEKEKRVSWQSLINMITGQSHLPKQPS